MTTPVTLREIHDQLAHPRRNDDRVIDDPAWISALMSMRPDPETLRRGDRWVETRSQPLGDGRTIYAVISRDEQGALRVTAHTQAVGMFAERRRITEEILGRPRGARIRCMNAIDLLHRTVTSEYGAVCHVSGLTFDASTGTVWIELLDLDEDGDPIPGTEEGVASLEGWDIH
jgi:hypothetical protein